jgi:hypothetical protein
MVMQRFTPLRVMARLLWMLLVLLTFFLLAVEAVAVTGMQLLAQVVVEQVVILSSLTHFYQPEHIQ